MMKNSTQFTVRSTQFTRITLIGICILFIACAVTYDMPVMYKKNYVPGTHALLQYDGYYYTGNERGYSPMFLYRDGSVWFGEMRYLLTYLDIELAKKVPNVQYSWGNYQIDKDTIVVERFKLFSNTNNYRRITLKGIVRKDVINWFLYQENRMNPDTVNYNSVFKSYSPKPDSTKNWTRKRPQYNK
jgi:hypothetical protein